MFLFENRLVIILLVGILAFVFKAVSLSGALKPIHEKSDVNCTLLPQFSMIQDLTEFRGDRLLLSWSSAQQAERTGGLSVIRLDPDGKTLSVATVELLGMPTGDLAAFHPVSLSVFRSEFAEMVFVINSNAGGHSVEVFEVLAEASFRHRRTVRDSTMMTSPSGLSAVSPTQFYWLNDSMFKGMLARFFFEFLGLKTGSLVYYNGQQALSVARGLAYPSGLAVHGDYLHVAETNAHRLLTYRMAASGQLQLRSVTNFDRSPARLRTSRAGLWVALHANTLRAFAHALLPSINAPSQVLLLDCDPTYARCTQDERLMSNGSLASLVSVVQPWSSILLLGQAYRPGLLACPLH